nr:transcription termination factor 3; mitochondrial-like [Biomphalaria glabrata]
MQDVRFHIKEFIGFSDSELKEIILKEPSLYMNNKNAMVKRFEYLHNTMLLDHHQVVQWPGVLSSRMFIIKTRHMFLLSLGRAQYDPCQENFVSLKALVTGTDQEFCHNVAKCDVNKFYDFYSQIAGILALDFDFVAGSTVGPFQFHFGQTTTWNHRTCLGTSNRNQTLRHRRTGARRQITVNQNQTPYHRRTGAVADQYRRTLESRNVRCLYLTAREDIAVSLAAGTDISVGRVDPRLTVELSHRRFLDR